MTFSRKRSVLAAPSTQSFASLKEQHRSQKRAAIESAAAVAFAEKGFRSATVAEIARAAGITPGTIYLYFGSKEDLLFATVLAEIDDLERRMRDVLAGAGSALVVLRRMMGAYWEFCSERPHGFQMLMAGLAHDARSKASVELTAAYDRRAAGCLALLREVLGRGMAEGVVRSGDASELALAIWGACHGILQLAVSSADPSRFVGFEVADLFDRTCDALLHGIAVSTEVESPR